MAILIVMALVWIAIGAYLVSVMLDGWRKSTEELLREMGIKPIVSDPPTSESEEPKS